MRDAKRDPAWMLVSVVMLFFFSAFLLISFKEEQVNWQGLLLSIAVPAMIFIGTMVLPRLFPADKLLLTLTNFLCAVGVLLLYRIKPEYGLDQAFRYGVGLALMLITILVIHRLNSWRWLAFAAIFLTLGFMAVPIVIGTTINGAKSWISIAGQSLQPSELTKISFLVVLAYYMSRHKMLPWLFAAVGSLGLLMLQKDLGTALMYYFTTLFLYYASTSNLPLTMIGAAGGAGAAVAGYALSNCSVTDSHCQRRTFWRGPWFGYAKSHTGIQIRLYFCSAVRAVRHHFWAVRTACLCGVDFARRQYCHLFQRELSCPAGHGLRADDWGADLCHHWWGY